MYCTVVYFWALKEINELSAKLKNIGYGAMGNTNAAESLVSSSILSEYL